MKKYVLGMLMVFVLFSCKDPLSLEDNVKKEKLQGSENELLPLAIGNEWTYTHNEMGYDETITLKVDSDTLINGSVWYFVNEDLHHNFFIRNKEDGLYRVDEEGLEEAVCLYPAQNGEYTDYDKNDYSFRRVTVISQDTLIEIPAGKFHCYYCEDRSIDTQTLTPGDKITKFFYKPGVGIIKVEDFNIVDNQIEEYWKLVSYKVKE